MRRITTLALAAACLTLAATAFATPLPNSAVVHTRVFNDCPVSVLNVNNLFPGLIQIDDQNVVPPFCAGFANLHTWRFSTNGVDPIQFLNGDTFEYSATLTLNGVGEGGLSLAPWWSPDPDGLFNVRTTDGEIACFGGRLPFFSFTGAFGLHYVNNTQIQLGISYLPNGLSSVSPAAVVYNLRYAGTNYTSGLLNFDQGNPAEDPPHGQWGALTPWYAGGHMKMFVQLIGQPHGITGTWNDIQYTSGPTPTTKSSWGQIKKLYR
ncbi:MAG TPA: hypothetical protein VN896_05775 [Methylomirabilota bacterium]|jgi:hypothetical protein|nr:hypothetical protein [Methylomirabilota bacterium]